MTDNLPALERAASLLRGMTPIIDETAITLGLLYGLRAARYVPEWAMAALAEYETLPDDAPILTAGIGNALRWLAEQCPIATQAVEP